MTPADRAQAKTIFGAAIDLPASKRRAYLDQHCGIDTPIRREVESLLEAFGEIDASFMKAPAFRADPLSDVDEPQNMRLGQYTIVRKIGQGGMGRVYEAMQDNPRRTVALKLIRSVLATPEVLRRFKREAQVLGQLQHPGIATIYETGSAPISGVGDTTLEQPFISMERIDGVQLTEYVRSRTLATKEILELFMQICSAVQHAHDRGVIHRDLKPANILVDQNGHIKILDFGVARLTDADARVTTIGTDASHLVGTLPYMSPEQVRGNVDQVDHRCDIYALGVILYELLCSRQPLDLAGRTLIQSVQIIQEVDPTRLGSIDRNLRGDVETIVEKALEKDRDRRYDSAAALSADIRRYLNDEPIVARPATSWYQFQKFARRNKGLVAGLVFGGIALFLGMMIAVEQAFIANRARTVAEQREQMTIREAYRANITAASMALTNHDISLARRSLDAIPEQNRHWEWRYLSGALDHSVRSIAIDTGVDRTELTFVEDVDGLRLRVRSADKIDDWTVPDGRHLSQSTIASLLWWKPTHEGKKVDPRSASPSVDPANVIEIARDESKRFVAWIEGDRVFRRNLSQTVAESVEINDGGTEIHRLAVASNGDVIMASAIDGRPGLWRSGSDRLEALKDVQGFVRSVAFDSARNRIIGGLQNTTVCMWDLGSLALMETARGHRHAVSDVAMSPTGDSLATVSLDRTIILWDAESLTPRAVLHGHDRGIQRVTFSPDGHLLATLSEDGTLRVWNADTVVEPGVISGHDGLVFPVMFSPDGSLIASAGSDRTVRVWDARNLDWLHTFSVDADVVSVLAFNANNNRLVAGTDDGLTAWSLIDASVIASSPVGGSAQPEAAPIRALSFLENGTDVLLPPVYPCEALRVWDTNDGGMRDWDCRQLSPGQSSYLNQDGSFLAMIQDESEGSLRSSQADSGAKIVILNRTTGDLVDLPSLSGAFAFHPESGRASVVAARYAEDRSRVGIWDLRSPKLLTELAGHTGDVYAIAYSPDGNRIATAGRDGLRLWDPNLGEEILELRGHRSFVWSVMFSPDGQRIISGSGDGTVRVWDATPISDR